MDKEKKSSKQKNQEEKIILPENLQREMIKFFLNASIPKVTEQNKEHQSTLEIKRGSADENCLVQEFI